MSVRFIIFCWELPKAPGSRCFDRAGPRCPASSAPGSLSQRHLSAALPPGAGSAAGCCPSASEQGEVAQVVTDKRRFNLPPIFLPLSHAKKHAPLASPALPLARAIYKPVQLTNPAEKLPSKKKSDYFSAMLRYGGGGTAWQWGSGIMAVSWLRLLRYCNTSAALALQGVFSCDILLVLYAECCRRSVPMCNVV